jgi:hypothetical protein
MAKPRKITTPMQSLLGARHQPQRMDLNDAFGAAGVRDAVMRAKGAGRHNPRGPRASEGGASTAMELRKFAWDRFRGRRPQGGRLDSRLGTPVGLPRPAKQGELEPRCNRRR